MAVPKTGKIEAPSTSTFAPTVEALAPGLADIPKSPSSEPSGEPARVMGNNDMLEGEQEEGSEPATESVLIETADDQKPQAFSLRIHSIQGVCDTGAAKEYLVRWANGTETWEAMETLHGSEEMLRNFLDGQLSTEDANLREIILKDERQQLEKAKGAFSTTQGNDNDSNESRGVKKTEFKKDAVEGRYKCDWPNCSASFSWPSVLTIHRRKHTGEKPFKCDWTGCESAFAKPSALTRHRRMHTGERPYKCDWTGCGRAFAYSNTLTEHRRTHTGEKPYKCDWADCTSAFAQSSLLTVHRRIHTGEKPYKCTHADCVAAFISSSALSKHKRTHTTNGRSGGKRGRAAEERWLDRAPKPKAEKKVGGKGDKKGSDSVAMNLLQLAAGI